MKANLTPYRRFPGTTAEAMDFYREIFDGELTAMPFSDVHSPEEVGDAGDLIMHAELHVDSHPVLFASDVPPGMDVTRGEDTPLSLTGGKEQEEELRGYWEKLSDGAAITMELEAVPWGAVYGALVDRYGTSWMFNISAA